MPRFFFVSQGLVAGCDDGVLYLFKKADGAAASGAAAASAAVLGPEDNPYYRLARKLHVDNHPYKITSLDLSPSDGTLVVALESNQLFTLRMQQATGTGANAAASASLAPAAAAPAEDSKVGIASQC